MNPFRVLVSDLVHRPGARRPIRVSGILPGLGVSGSHVPEQAEVEVAVMLEWVQDGVLASGRVLAPWKAECRRCLGPAEGVLEAEVRELFEEHPREGESYPLRHDQVDLGPLALEAVLLELPNAPLCREECAGLCPSCGADLNEGPCTCVPDRDPRWAALDALRPDR